MNPTAGYILFVNI